MGTRLKLGDLELLGGRRKRVIVRREHRERARAGEGGLQTGLQDSQESVAGMTRYPVSGSDGKASKVSAPIPPQSARWHPSIRLCGPKKNVWPAGVVAAVSCLGDGSPQSLEVGVLGDHTKNVVAIRLAPLLTTLRACG